MGKNFPQIKNLREKPSCFEATLKLIEESFSYKAPNSFQTDFAPLMDRSNHHNCFILIDENDGVLAHVGVKERKINIENESFTITMLGGIAVDKTHRGQGHFQTLFQDVLAEKRSDATLFLLWSDQESLYTKFGFHLCGEQFELSQKDHNKEFKLTTYAQLTPTQKEDVKVLYNNSFKKIYLSTERDASDWNLLEKITSSELYYQEADSKITAYFFKGKGQDLGGIIHEYGSSHDITSHLEAIRNYGKVWMGARLIETESLHYQFMLAPADTKNFCRFIKRYTNDLIDLRDLNLMKQEAYFDFNQETLALSIEEFLRGIFGPAPFEELGDLRPVFFSGLDSI